MSEEYLSEQDLSAGVLPEDDVQLARGKIRVRGLSRGEVLSLQKMSNDATTLEQRILAAGMVKPKMTAKGVANWQKTAVSGELDAAVDKVNELSGLVQGAQKSDVPGTGDES